MCIKMHINKYNVLTHILPHIEKSNIFTKKLLLQTNGKTNINFIFQSLPQVLLISLNYLDDGTINYTIIWVHIFCNY